jgi:hypothetical protein
MMVFSHLVNAISGIYIAGKTPTCNGAPDHYYGTFVFFYSSGLIVTVLNVRHLYYTYPKLEFNHYTMTVVYNFFLLFVVSWKLAFNVLSTLSALLTLLGALIGFLSMFWLCGEYFGVCISDTPGTYNERISSLFGGCIPVTLFLLGTAIELSLVIVSLTSFTYADSLYYFGSKDGAYFYYGYHWNAHVSSDTTIPDLFERCIANYNLTSAVLPSLGGTVYQYNTFSGNHTDYTGGCCRWLWSGE